MSLPSQKQILLRIAVFVASMAGLVLGCARTDKPVVTEIEDVAPNPLSVVFVEIPDVSEEVTRQWLARRNGVIHTTNISTTELSENGYSACDNYDVIVYPSVMMGQLIADKKINVLPDEVWDSEELGSRGLLRDCRTTLVRLGGKRWATPLGSPNFFMFTRQDVLLSLDVAQPETWSDLAAFAERLRSADAVEDTNGIALPDQIFVPLEGDSAAHSFLAITAAFIRHRGKLSALFDRNTMEPLIDRQPFVEALELLKTISSSTNVLDPLETTRSFLNGEAAVAIGWPSRASLLELGNSNFATTYEKTNLSRLPGSLRWYDFTDSAWKPMEFSKVNRVELIGFAGRQVSILQSTRHPTTAYDFLSWISSKQTGSNIFSKSRWGAPSRISHLANPQEWAGDVFTVENADNYSEYSKAINENPIYLMFPRIRESHRYLSSLATAIRGFLNGNSDAADVLKQVAEHWDKLTDEIGRDIQRELL